MTFANCPHPDACRSLKPISEDLPPGPVDPPKMCHRPEGHDGPHSTDRNPSAMSLTWEGDLPAFGEWCARCGRRVSDFGSRDCQWCVEA